MRRAGILVAREKPTSWHDEMMAFVDELRTPEKRLAAYQTLKGLIISERAERGAPTDRDDDKEHS